MEGVRRQLFSPIILGINTWIHGLGGEDRMHARNIVLTVVGLLLVAASGATAGAVTGQVALGGKSGGCDAVVYLQGSVKSQPLAHATVDQRDKMFLPHVSVVTQGTTVHFPNDDTVFHNVFAYFQAKKFDLGMYPRGATKSVTFDKTGLVVLLCNIHSDMSAYILVVDTPYYAVTDQQGRYRIPTSRREPIPSTPGMRAALI